MKNYVEVTANTYTTNDLKKMEGRIMVVLDFDLNVVTSLSLLQAVNLKSSLTSNALSFCKYILEVSML